MRRGVATFTLDHGTCPPWLFERMVKLGREMIQVMAAEYGPDEFVRRMGDPVWFQTLGTVLAFDWNASGLTTVLTGALKEAIRGQERDLGFFICGGKGKTSLKTPAQIEAASGEFNFSPKAASKLVHNSKMSAKVDSSLVQDGFQLYHHVFIFSKSGSWTVVQQGMNQTAKTARRYHWHSGRIRDLVEEPHSGIISDALGGPSAGAGTLNLSAKKSRPNRDLSVEMVNSGFRGLNKDIQLLARHASALSRMIKIKQGPEQLTLLELTDVNFKTHPVMAENFRQSRYLKKILAELCERKPKSYQKMLALRGVGPATIRALSLVSEVIYGARASYQDPARYSFAHGGKDAIPFPVDRETYDDSIRILAEVVRKSKISWSEKNKMEKKLKKSGSSLS